MTWGIHRSRLLLTGLRVWLPLLVGLLFAAYRFFNQDLVPFISDEPAFLRAANEQLLTGDWVSASPLIGNQGLHYGPTVLWFYGCLHKLLGPGPGGHILVMTILVTLSNVCAALAIGRFFVPKSQVAAALVAFVASSPYHFMWSRMAWDQSVEILSGLSVAILCTDAPLRARRAGAVGLLMGFAVSSHLMVTLLAALTGAYFLLASRGWRRLWNSVTYGCCILLVNIPYLRYLTKSPRPDMPSGGPVALEGILSELLEPLRVSTTQQIQYFFDSDWTSFSKEAGPIGLLPQYCDQQWAVVGALLVALVWAAAKGPRKHRSIAAFALVVWVGYAVFLAHRHLDPHPHYQFPTWWVILAAVAAALSRFVARDRSLYRIGIGVVWAVAFVQMLFVVQWMSYIRNHGGTRGIHYGATLSEQTQAVREACLRPGKRTIIDSEVTIFARSIEYLASAIPSCRDKEITVSNSAFGANVRLKYLQSDSAFLVVQ
jgi:hypothetical protein